MAFIFISDPYRWEKALYRFKEVLGRAIRHRIFSAIERGDDEQALNYASRRVLLRSTDEWGRSALVAAIAENRLVLVNQFVQRGGMRAGDGALALAAMRGHVAIVELLLVAEKNPNEPLQGEDGSSRGYTPLMWAVSRKHIAVARALLVAGADVNAVAPDGSTAAMFTRKADASDLEMLELLCSYNADLTIKDSRGRNIIREARDRSVCSGMPEMLEIIKRHHPETDFDSA